MNENNKLHSIVENLPIIRQLYDKEAHLTVLDAEGVVLGYSIPEGERPILEVGSVFEDPSGSFDEVIRKGVKKHNFLPKEVMGTAFEGNLVPVKDGGKVVGCITCTYSVEEETKIRRVTEQFKKSVENIDESIQDVVSGMESLFSMLTEMNEMTSGVEGDVNGAADVVSKISSNASLSNILALNASIEAARSGEAGRGFAVVASEMGKLAKDSSGSADQIKKILDGIIQHLGTITSSIKDANEVAKSHMESINGIKEVLEQTISLAEELEADAER